MTLGPRRCYAGAAASLIAAILCPRPPLLAHPAHQPGDSIGSALGVDAGLRGTLSMLESRVEQRPGDTIALGMLASARLRYARATAGHREYAAALDEFDRLLTLDPSARNARIGRAYALVGLHRFSEALREARDADRQSSDGTTVALLADVHLALGDYTEARALATQLADASITPESLGRLAVIAQELGEYQSARSLWADTIEAARLLDSAPSVRGWALTMLGDLNREDGTPDEAERCYRAAIGLDGGAHAAAFGLATLTRERGDLTEAEAVLTALVAGFPSMRYRVALGDVLSMRGDASGRDQAAELFREAEQEMISMIKSGDLGHARDLIEFWLAHGGDPDRAARLAQRDLNEVRRDIGGYEVAARAFGAAGRWDEALDAATTAVHLAPGKPSVVERCLPMVQKARADSLRAIASSE